LASSILESDSSDTKCSVNLEKLKDIPYLSKKAIDSNLNSPQCIQYMCKDLRPNNINTSEDLIPFRINLCSSRMIEKEDEKMKDCVNLDINLVKISLILGSISSRFFGANSDLLQCLCDVRNS